MTTTATVALDLRGAEIIDQSRVTSGVAGEASGGAGAPRFDLAQSNEWVLRTLG